MYLHYISENNFYKYVNFTLFVTFTKRKSSMICINLLATYLYIALCFTQIATKTDTHQYCFTRIATKTDFLTCIAPSQRKTRETIQ